MKFKLSNRFAVDSEVEPWSNEGLRICLFGGSGSGKSWTACLFVEQWLAQGGTVVIFEPRAEYQTLKQKFDVLVVGGPFAKDVDFIPRVPSAFAKAIVNEGVSTIFYTSDVDDEEKLIGFVRSLVSYILKFNEVVKRPILIVIEEAQEYIPNRTSGRAVPPWVYARMIKAFKDCFLQGRKLNVSTIALSPRPQEVNFTVRQLANLTFYGKFSPQDIGYIDRECLKVYRDRGVKADASKLLDLKVGEWLVIHGAKADYIKVTEKRLTPHGAETPKLKYEVPKKENTKKTMNELVATIRQALERERKEKSELEKLQRKMGELQRKYEEEKKKVEQLNTALKVAGSLQVNMKRNVDMEDLSKLQSEVERLKKSKQRLLDVLQALQNRIIKVLNEFSEKTLVEEVGVSSSVVEMWLNKLPTRCSRRIFKFLVDHKGMKFTKSQIALQTGYKATSGGVFGDAFRILKQNNLIKTDGKLFWVE